MLHKLHSLFFNALLLLLLIPAYITTKENQSLTEHVTDQYLHATFGPEKKEESPAQKTDTDLGFFEKLNQQFDSKKQTLSTQEAHYVAFDIVCNCDTPFETNIVNLSVIDKMELISGGEDAQAHLFAKIFNLNTAIGKAFTAFTFCHPIQDISILHKRQNTITFLSKNKPILHAIDSALKQISSVEEKSLLFWSSKPPVNPEFLKMSYFGNTIDLGGMLKKLNTNAVALELMGRTLQTLITSLTCIMPLGGMASVIYNYAQAHQISYSQAYHEIACEVASVSDLFENNVLGAKIGLAFMALYLVLIDYVFVIAAKSQAEIYNHLQDVLIALATHTNALKKIGAIVKHNKTLHNNLPSLQPLIDLVDNKNISDKLKKLLGMLDTNTFKGEPSFFSYTGRILAAYELMNQVKDELIPALVAAGELDMYIALAKLYSSREEKDARYCMAEFINNDSPVIEAHGFWNPFINPDTVILNDALFDATNPNKILTGPNTGGKSTVIKAIMINILMAQTFGIAPSQRLIITPFSVLDCFMNISDDIAIGASLFKAEVIRAKKILEMLQSLKANEFSFIIIDEIFTGTSPQEGEIAACRFTKQMGDFKNNISIIATHYPKMIDLEKETNGIYRNHYVEILRNEDGSLNRTFKFKDGASRLNVAFDILAEEGILI